ncbi:unnamed protein product, partial [Effrenium voratum]
AGGLFHGRHDLRRRGLCGARDTGQRNGHRGDWRGLVQSLLPHRADDDLPAPLRGLQYPDPGLEHVHHLLLRAYGAPGGAVCDAQLTAALPLSHHELLPAGLAAGVPFPPRDQGSRAAKQRGAFGEVQGKGIRSSGLSESASWRFRVRAVNRRSMALG